MIFHVIILILAVNVGSLRHYCPKTLHASRKALRMGVVVPEEPVLQQGVVLVSKPGEHNHFLYQQAVFLYEYTQRGSRGVILERPTAFTMGEMSPGIGVFEANTLFMGGEDGDDMAIMMHSYNMTGNVKYVGAGVFVGGMKQAREMVEARQAAPKEFKFFFNGIEWAPGVLEREIELDRWDVVEATADVILRQGAGATLWQRARQEIIKSQLPASRDDNDDE
jgi:putative AlgH/UPF0301 family transcriptional regulator